MSMQPPMVPPEIPPSLDDRKPRVTWKSLLGKPANLSEAGLVGIGSTPTTGPLHLRADGEPPLIVERLDSGPGDYGVIRIMRDGGTLGFLSVDANDNLALIAPDGTTVYARFSKALPFSGDIDAAIGVNPILELRRQGTAYGYVGLDASDHLAIIASDGVTVLAYTDDAGIWRSIDAMQAVRYLDDAGNQVVGAQEPAIADSTSSSSSTGMSSAGGIPHASTDPVSSTDFDFFVDDYNGLWNDVDSMNVEFNQLRLDFIALVSAHNTLLAELREGTGHGLIAP